MRRLVVLLAVPVLAAACQSPTLRGSPTAGHSPVTTQPATTGSVNTGSGALDKFQSQLQEIASEVQPDVVQINTPDGLGSGVVFDGQGDIVTNDHVVSGASSLTVLTSSGHHFSATLVGAYPAGDLAVVHVSNLGIKPAAFGDSAALKVGDIVLALGSPYGLQGTVTEGIVSAVGRSEDEGNGVTLKDLIQTSAPVYPGDSGGALVDLSGHVMGMPTLSSGTGGRRASAAPSVAFAIPSKSIVQVANQLIAQGKVTHTGTAYLGVQLQDNPSGGALVSSVVAGGPAARAGLQPRSVIEAIGDTSIADVDGVSQALAALKPGDKVTLKVTLPDGSGKTLTVTLGELPAS
jgi:S1-C subfamily serine protease